MLKNNEKISQWKLGYQKIWSAQENLRITSQPHLIHSSSSQCVPHKRKKGFAYNQWTLIRERAITLTCFAFVDDTDLIHSNDDPDVPTSQLLQEAQAALTTWEGLIRASGGDLAPEKGYWYLVEVVRRDGKWRYTRESESPGSLHLQYGTHASEHMEPYRAKEALGIMIRPDGNMKDEAKVLRDKVILWSDALRTNKIKPEEAWYCLNATILKTIEYPLLATTFSRSQLERIMRPILQVALNKCKIQKRLPRKLVYGTLRSRGLGIKDPYLVQLIQHVLTILRHSHRDTPTHDLLDENMDLVQFHVGSELNFWDLPFAQYGCLAPRGWIKHTWECLADTPLSLRGPSLALPKLRHGDVFLMDAFVNQGYEDEDLCALNDCRLHLKIHRLSEIATACGNRIEPRAWAGKSSWSWTPTRWIVSLLLRRTWWASHVSSFDGNLVKSKDDGKKLT